MLSDTSSDYVQALPDAVVFKQELLRCITSKKGFFISDIARETGRSITTAIKYVHQMRDEGLIIPLDKPDNQGKGRRSIRFGINPNRAYFVGVEVVNFAVNLGLMNFCGELVAFEKHEFVFENTYACMEYVCSVIPEFISSLANCFDSDSFAPERIAAVCITLPERVNTFIGTSPTVFNFEDHDGRALADVLGERLGYRVIIQNDPKGKAWGDYCSGLDRQYRNLLYINMSWGTGLCIIINGQIYYGMDGYSGEVGHIHIFENNIMCYCGKKGCLETEISGRAVARKVTERILDGEKSLLSRKVLSGEELRLGDIVWAMEREDPLTLEIIESTGLMLGAQIAMLINLFNPQAVVIGGSLVDTEVNYLMYSLKMGVSKYSLKLMSRNVALLTSTLKDRAGVTGACYIARQRTISDIIAAGCAM